MSLIISAVVYIIGGISTGERLNTLRSYDMTMHKWTTLQPMKENVTVMQFAFKGIGLLWLEAIVVQGTSTHVRPSTHSRRGLFYPTLALHSHLVVLPTIV